uniref:Xenopsin n=1 Tax=Dendrocoelum lacteum TaxID=27895 RepID=A0A5K8CG16_9PLAT|nr:TPA_inf: xenopsin [Dendrocoelum lacteum]
MFFTGLNSIAIMTVVAMDRFFVIAKPTLAPHITKGVIYVSIAGCSVYSLLFTVPPLFGWNEYTLDRSFISCSINFESRNPLFYSYTIVILIFCYFIPIIINVCCYYYIYMTIRIVARRSHAVSNQSDDQNKKIEQKMLQVSLAVFSSFVVVWTPYAVVCMWTVFGDPLSIPLIVSTTPSVWAKSMVVIYPFVFVLNNKHFRDVIAEKAAITSVFNVIKVKRINPIRTTNNTMELTSEL